MSTIEKSLTPIFPVTYIAFGLLQLAATFAGITDWLGWHWILAGPVSLVLAYVPVLGTITGICGAHYGWDWSWGASLTLFFLPLLFWVFMGIVFAARR